MAQEKPNNEAEKDGITVSHKGFEVKITGITEHENVDYSVYDKRAQLIFTCRAKKGAFIPSEKEGIVGEITNAEEPFLNFRNIFHEDGTITTHFIQGESADPDATKEKRLAKKGNIIRVVTKPADGKKTTIVPYQGDVKGGRRTDLTVETEEILDKDKKKMRFKVLAKDGKVLFTKDMNPSKSHRRKSDGFDAHRFLPGGALFDLDLPGDKKVEIRGKEGYLIYYEDVIIGGRSNTELYMEYDDGPIAYIFFADDNRDEPESIIYRDGAVKRVQYVEEKEKDEEKRKRQRRTPKALETVPPSRSK